ncbi:class I SAM-dependent methyltransferase [Rhodomicrobium sp. Az07]|uniref:class I SAM-dependent DNA methyltransferase n=1 Tax=Rhodomicrobium sp. Az07 TaxID=2839034 RepID=UPI001BEB2D84|nr:class I SAM-dependent methyltransferase [Rhodomicrobium sp. Az07]MBT3069774.1 class I SAM-dependent methyltransferase [Rhodomicrobium sp. Az07]
MADVFDAYSRYYDLLYRDKDYVSEADYIARLLKAYGSGRELLEFGSGTGRHGRLFAERGYRVLGIERSPEMIAASTETEGFSCRQGDVCTLDLGYRFDAVLALFHVVCYQTSNSAVCALFDRAALHLKQGGIFIFDVWYSPAVYSQKPAVRVKRISDATTEITRIAEPYPRPNENVVDVNYLVFVEDVKSGGVQKVDETHPMRHFSLPELDLIAEHSGFERVAAEEFLTGQKPGENTWGVCIVMKKVR